jgi:hypothetical protein
MVATALFRDRGQGLCQWKTPLCEGIIQTQAPNRSPRFGGETQLPIKTRNPDTIR